MSETLDSARAAKRNWFRPQRSYYFDDESSLQVRFQSATLGSCVLWNLDGTLFAGLLHSGCHLLHSSPSYCYFVCMVLSLIAVRCAGLMRGFKAVSGIAAA